MKTKDINLEIAKNKEFFDDIDGKSLDEQQRKAVVIDADSVQIIAGAGTGKTLTLQAKVKYLIEKKGIKPNEILCISYSNASVNDLKKRMAKLNVGKIDIKTFHSLGNSILKDNNEYSGVDKYALNTVVKKYFHEKILNDSKLSEDILKFFAYYFPIPHDNVKYLGEKIDKESNYTLIDLYNKYEKAQLYELNPSTLNSDKVKSIEELKIANFLFLNGIEYVYEGQYVRRVSNYNNYLNYFKNSIFPEDDDILIPEKIKVSFSKNLLKYAFGDNELVLPYKPDFYLPEYDIYLEHFGVDRNCNAKWLTPEKSQKYKKEMIMKRKTHKENNTKLIETYSYYQFENRLIERLSEKLKDAGVKFKKIDYQLILKTLIEWKHFQDYKEFTKLIKSFINLFKGNDYDESYFKEFYKINEKEENPFLKERNLIFLNLIEDIYKEYTKYLKENKLLDFNDMINNARISIINRGYHKSYKYIIVDEYQDTSYTRYNLLKTIQDELKAKVIVVGDDWQSIYKFSGCDVDLFTNFDNYFNKPVITHIESTYRNSQDLIDASGKFVMKNPMQVKKSLKSESKHKISKPIKLVYYTESNQEAFALESIIDEIIKKEHDDKCNILILGRNKLDILRLLIDENGEYNSNNLKFKDLTSFNSIYKYQKNLKLLQKLFEEYKYVKLSYLKNPNVNIIYRTVHSSKGLEEDNVILINLKNKSNGFPNKIEDEPILDFVTRNSENFNFSEERRLFYVALTRTRKNIYLLAPSQNKSEFIEEIEKDNDNLEINYYDTKKENINPYKTRRIPTNLKCKNCVTGNINLVVTPNGKKFFSCSHWPRCDENLGSFYGSIDDLNDIEYCPKCDGVLYKIDSKNGKFFKCSNKECGFTKDDLNNPNLEFKPTKAKCPDCGKQINIKINKKSGIKVLICSDEICGFARKYYGELKDLNYVDNCPDCGGIITKKTGQYGEFIGCTNYPECKYIENLEGNTFKKSNNKDKSNVDYGNCPKCGNPLTKKTGPYGEFIGCTNYPTCKHTEKLNENNSNQKYGNCPKCGNPLTKKTGPYGEFIGCTNYPTCKHTEKL